MPLTETGKLVGRADETAMIEALVSDARRGRAAALVVRGEAGIGKSALLEHAAANADGMRLLRGSAVESEAELPFAGLHLLLGPVGDSIDRLPAPHAGVLRSALGTGSGESGSRFSVGVAVLTLLAELSKESPVLALVDDAHWLDCPTKEALVFAARRLGTERVALLFAAREPDAPPFPTRDIDQLHLDGLGTEAAEALLRTHAADLPRHLADQVVAEAMGNPLALLELSSALLRGGGRPEPDALAPLPAPDRVTKTFAARIRSLPERARTVLLVAAADGTCDTGRVLAAARLLGADITDLRLAEDAGLLGFTQTCLWFRHPLVRTAAYHDALLQDRIAAHRALAQVLDQPDDADRRAWHLAAASTGPDEEIAAELERSAEHARARGGYSAVVVAYERAAALTPRRAERGRRLLAASRAATDAGQPQRACELARQATAQLTEPTQKAKAAMIHATLADDQDQPVESRRVLRLAADEVATSAPELASELLFWAVGAAWSAGESATVAAIADHAETLRLPGTDRIRALATAAAGDLGGATLALRWLLDGPSVLKGCVDQALALRSRTRSAGWHVLLGDHETAHEQAAELVGRIHADSADGVLPRALAVLAEAHLHLGRHREALNSAQQGMRLAEDIGQRHSVTLFAGVLARLAAIEGDEAAATAHAAETRAERAAAALGLLELGLGRHDTALDRLAALADDTDPLHAVTTFPDLVEAAVRARQPQRAAEASKLFTRWAQLSDATWALAVSLRCRALLGEDEDRLFSEAVELHRQSQDHPFERARTELVYGEYLRRARHRTRARRLLRSALSGFERLGARPWAERARTELRATGERLTRPAHDSNGTERLTPQELRIVLLAADGLSNRDIGEQLFLSPRTVGYHLYKAYPKLGVSSRRELGKLGLAS
ncbi:transcriptional regulator, luxR family [Saccharomonospora marina XMU15]|uniref:Transcriptional regulator, luxR family n=1 Tax=Saccharomonospora marina XMU15 TaxID=882083 RepID=H5X8Z3_9PSEU|nr:LuxR family transcriptional regulator [Saccharomonospora marina]EHR53596.1 transcriptional regulator, luxR family [Saccharomonospora marina XMU15]